MVWSSYGLEVNGGGEGSLMSEIDFRSLAMVWSWIVDCGERGFRVRDEEIAIVWSIALSFGLELAGVTCWSWGFSR